MLSCDAEAISFLPSDNATGLPSSELLRLLGTTCSVAEDTLVDDGFAKMSNLGVGGVASSSVDSCLTNDSESEEVCDLNVTAK